MNRFGRMAELLRKDHEALALSGIPVPDKRRTWRFADRLVTTMFPYHSRRPCASPVPARGDVEAALAAAAGDLRRLLPCGADGESVIDRFFDRLPEVYGALREDAAALYEGDPAARSTAEVIMAYPGFFALCVHRIAHSLLGLGVQVVPRILSEYAHERTGIDVHPGAKIGKGCAIDHGTGVVIGETTVIGERVKIYQGVTLGALSVHKEDAASKRHPTLENDVVVYANATVLGGDTVVGRGSVIGASALLTSSVPPGSRIYHTRMPRRGHSVTGRERGDAAS